MKRLIIVAGCIFVLALIVPYSYAQMGEGMMGGGQKQMMAPEGSQKTVAGTAGEKIFNDECASCHPNGGNIIVPGLPLKGSRVLANFRTFAAFIRHPKMPDGSEGSMPAFGNSKISGKQARELYHYIRSDWGYGAKGGYGMGPGMMGGGYGMKPGMMGGYGMGNYGMGPGMMSGGYGMGMGGYGMGPGMMGRHGMGPGSSAQDPECQKFYDDTLKMRKELHDKKFEYFEAVRNPKTTMETLANLQKEMRQLHDKIYSQSPLGCW